MAKNKTEGRVDKMDILRFVYALGNSGVFLDHHSLYFGESGFDAGGVWEYSSGRIVNPSNYNTHALSDFLHMRHGTNDDRLCRPRLYHNIKTSKFPLSEMKENFYLTLPLYCSKQGIPRPLAKEYVGQINKPQLVMKIDGPPGRMDIVQRAAIIASTKDSPDRFSDLKDFFKFCLPEQLELPILWSHVSEYDSKDKCPRIILCQRFKPVADYIRHGREFVSLIGNQPFVEGLVQRVIDAYVHMSSDFKV